MHGQSDTFDDTALEERYRHGEFTRKSTTQICTRVLIVLLLILQTAATLQLMSGVLCLLFAIGCVVRAHLTVRRHDSFRLQAWVIVCFVLAAVTATCESFEVTLAHWLVDTFLPIYTKNVTLRQQGRRRMTLVSSRRSPEVGGGADCRLRGEVGASRDGRTRCRVSNAA